MEFTFTTYLNGTELLQALENLTYKGGNTRTGAGLKFLADNFFNPATSRDVPKVRGPPQPHLLPVQYCYTLSTRMG